MRAPAAPFSGRGRGLVRPPSPRARKAAAPARPSGRVAAVALLRRSLSGGVATWERGHRKLLKAR
eukprot:13970088-Alexandrium_andersonii.AAC.1